MNILESVLVSYENKNRIIYQDYAEFLRLIGVYVCEDLRYGEDYDADFDRSESAFSISYNIDNTMELEDRNSRFELLKRNIQSNIQSKDFGNWFDKLVLIYQKNELLQASVTLQYFRTHASEVLEAGKKFEKAADELIELIKSQPDLVSNRYVRYAKLYCKQKANLANFLCKEPIIYYVDDLAAEGISIIKSFPDFTNAWVLLGLIYEISEEFGREAVKAFQTAIENMGEKPPYVASIYYWLGRQSEKYKELKKLENDSYKKSHELIPKYRNIYKVARIYMNEGKWQKALSFFKECIKKLEKKKNFIDPLEQEYYFKVNVHMTYIYLKIKDYNNAIQSGLKAVEFRNDILAGKNIENDYKKFYVEMYSKEKAEKYIELELKRMGCKQVYQYLATAYQELGMEKEAEKYWELARA